MQYYDREKAVEYAYEWFNKRNPNFYDFDNLGGDCTNFICQCLLYAGYKMKVDINNGWFYKSLNYRSPSFTGVQEFYNFCINNNSSEGVKAKLVSINELEIGDIVQLKQNDRYNHTLLITKIDKNKENYDINDINSHLITTKDIYVTAHTFDVKDKKLALYPYKEIRYLKLYTSLINVKYKD